MQIRPFRVRAASPDEAAMKARDKCPEEIAVLKVWRVMGDWYEVQAVILPEEIAN